MEFAAVATRPRPWKATVPAPVPLLSARRTKSPPLGTEMIPPAALPTVMFRAADRVNVVGADQDTFARTPMSPACPPGLPAAPVVTVTSAAPSAVRKVVALITEFGPLGVNTPFARLPRASGPLVMNTL